MLYNIVIVQQKQQKQQNWRKKMKFVIMMRIRGRWFTRRTYNNREEATLPAAQLIKVGQAPRDIKIVEEARIYS